MTTEQKMQFIQKIKDQTAAKYKKFLIIGIVVALIVGIMLGMVTGLTGLVTPELISGATPAPTITPIPDETPEPVYEPGDRMNPIADGSVYTFDTEISDTGTPRVVAGETDTYVTANVSISATRLMTPRYFDETYRKQYKLNGNEAGVQIDIKLNSLTGDASTFVPQDALVITLEAEDGTVDGGYQLMDTEIANVNGISLKAGEAIHCYKRFDWNTAKPMKYLAVQYYAGGMSNKVYFELSEDAVVVDNLKSDAEIAAEDAITAPAETTEAGETSETVKADSNVTVSVTANPSFPTLKRGGKNNKKHVTELQKLLIKFGYMKGKADGDFGKGTEEAVKKAQKDWGLEETGVADPLFLTIISLDDPMSAVKTTGGAVTDAVEPEEAVEDDSEEITF